MFCIHKSIGCDTFVLNQTSLKQHLDEDCPYAYVQCPNYDEHPHIMRKDVKDHESKCGFRKCENCMKSIMLDRWDAHQAKNCPSTLKHLSLGKVTVHETGVKTVEVFIHHGIPNVIMSCVYSPFSDDDDVAGETIMTFQLQYVAFEAQYIDLLKCLENRLIRLMHTHQTEYEFSPPGVVLPLETIQQGFQRIVTKNHFSQTECFRVTKKKNWILPGFYTITFRISYIWMKYPKWGVRLDLESYKLEQLDTPNSASLQKQKYLYELDKLDRMY